jgi:hypothetical protein
MVEVDDITQAVAASTWFESLAVVSRPLHRRLAKRTSRFGQLSTRREF